MATKEQWNELGKALGIIIAAFIIFLTLIYFALAASTAHAQVPPAPLPMPPDLLHVSQRGCHIDGHDAGTVLDAKTGEEVHNRLWTVTPFVKYDDRRTFTLPDGTASEEWKPVTKSGEDKWIAAYPGTSDFIPHEATDACSAWMKALDKAKVKAIHDAGHEVGVPK